MENVNGVMVTNVWPLVRRPWNARLNRHISSVMTDGEKLLDRPLGCYSTSTGFVEIGYTEHIRRIKSEYYVVLKHPRLLILYGHYDNLPSTDPQYRDILSAGASNVYGAFLSYTNCTGQPKNSETNGVLYDEFRTSIEKMRKIHREKYFGFFTVPNVARKGHHFCYLPLATSVDSSLLITDYYVGVYRPELLYEKAAQI